MTLNSYQLIASAKNTLERFPKKTAEIFYDNFPDIDTKCGSYLDIRMNMENPDTGEFYSQSFQTDLLTDNKETADLYETTLRGLGFEVIRRDNTKDKELNE